MEEPVEYLVSRRSRRSTAGNRMEAALAEMALDDANKDLDDDKDFVNDKDEEDVFESDFESTDDEAQGEGAAETVEATVVEEEKRARRVARSRVEKATAAAHEKNKATFNPQAVSEKPRVKPKRRVVLLEEVIDAETGEIIDATETPGAKKRKSERMHTVRNTSATVTRMKESEEKKAATPKKPKIETRSFTQMELIARALDNEEGNIVEHRDYLKLEEEKRKRARVVRTAIEGPLLRWISKKQEIKVVVEPSPLPKALPNSAPSTYGPYGSGVSFPPMNYGAPQPSSGQSTISNDPGTSASASAKISPPFQVWPPPVPPVVLPEIMPNIDPQLQVQPPQPQGQPPQPQVQPPQPIISATPQEFSRLENVTKNYVVHEVAQYDGMPKPPWKDTMAAMFGNHVKWDELKVYVGKGRPLSRPKQICPITGKQARYLDPRTGVPFADAHAYDVLTRILRHEYVWSQELGCYVGQEEAPHHVMDIEDGSQESAQWMDQ